MKILLIGEYCKDIYIFGNVNRISPEAPVPILDYTGRMEEYDGMAGNVKNNLLALGLSVDSFYFNTGNKKRFIDETSKHQILRVDETIKNNKYDLNINNNVDYSVIVISDYNKGYITEDIIKKCRGLNIPIYVDTKNPNLSLFNGSILKINKKEYLNRKTDFVGDLIYTAGSDGAFYNNKNYSVKKVPVRDVTGAGDTFLAALVYGYSNNYSLEKSINIANVAASIVVSKPFTAVCSKEELEEKLNEM